MAVLVLLKNVSLDRPVIAVTDLRTADGEGEAAVCLLTVRIWVEQHPVTRGDREDGGSRPQHPHSFRRDFFTLNEPDSLENLLWNRIFAAVLLACPQVGHGGMRHEDS